MNSTALRLLTRDGMIVITFTPALTPEQYADLHSLCLITTTMSEMESVVREAAIRWGITVEIE